MNYYHITSGIDDEESDADSDNQWVKSQLQNAVQDCLSPSTVEDLMKEFSRNTSIEDNNNLVQNIKRPASPLSPVSPVSPPSTNGVLMRRSSSGRNSYSHRASKRFSRLLEGVTSLVSMTGIRTEEDQTDPQAYEQQESCGSASLPYWVEASQNISKEDSAPCEASVRSDSGYSSIAESAPPTVALRNRKLTNSADTSTPQDVTTDDLEKIEEKISEIFDSMNIEMTESVRGEKVQLRSSKSYSGPSGPASRDRRRKTVSGYFQDWTTWMGSVESKNKQEFERSASFSTDVTEIEEDAEDEKEDVPSAEEDLWSTWDKILVKWNSGAVTKCQEVKGLVRRGIPQHLRGITWQMLSGANLCDEKSGYIEYLATDSACEKAIYRDIARTYPEHDMFKKKDGAGQESLFNVMKAYSVHDREVGYCQGTAFIVGLLLMQMPEEESFAVLVKIMKDYGMREMFKPSMTELGLCMYQLDTLIEQHMPDLHVHFQSQAIHTNLFASRWFLTLFTSCVSVSLSSRILDSFLCEGREVLFRLALTLLMMAKSDLLQKDIEGVTKYFQHEMPHKFESDQDSIFNTAFSLTINQKLMKKIEKEYLTMKSKKTEDEMEIRRLRTENLLLRQKMDMLEQESSDLADRLIQDQVTRAEEQESLFLVRQDLEASLAERNELSEKLILSDTKCGNIQQELREKTRKLEESYKAREDTEKLLKTKSVELETLKKKMKEILNNNSVNVGNDADLRNLLIDEEVENIKKENEETKKDLQVLKFKIFDLKQMWKTHIQTERQSSSGSSVTSAPKKLLTSLMDGSASEVSKLEEELISCRLSEVDTFARLQESQERIREMEHKAKSSRHQLSRQDAIVLRLQEEMAQYKRKHSEIQTQLRESEIRMCNMEGKLKDERLMGRIAEAENSHLVAELRQKIADLQLQNEEIVTLDQVDNLNSIEDLIIDDNSEDDEETSSGVKSMSRSTSSSSSRLDSSNS